MSTIRVNQIRSPYQQSPINVSELTHRVIKTARSTYTGGAWEPSNAYGWMPAGYLDYTPASASSRIRFSLSLSFAHINGHAISHCIFYSNTSTEQGRHSISGQSPEHRHLYVWDFASWGTSNGRIGYQARRYSASNRPRFHGTTHWNGSGSTQNAQSEIVIEEYFPI